MDRLSTGFVETRGPETSVPLCPAGKERLVFEADGQGEGWNLRPPGGVKRTARFTWGWDPRPTLRSRLRLHITPGCFRLSPGGAVEFPPHREF